MQFFPAVNRSLQEESQKVSDADIEKYYKDKIDTTRRRPLQRLFHPRTKAGRSATQGSGGREER